MSTEPHLEFREDLPSIERVTKVWEVFAGRQKLGNVSWWAAWRRYVFFPAGDTLYDAGCLDLLATFCAERTRERKAERKNGGAG